MYKENVGSSKLVKKLGLKLVESLNTKSGIQVEKYKIKVDEWKNTFLS